MNDEPMGCPMCDGESIPLGSLGSRMYLRCRQCGWGWSVAADEEMDGEAA